MIYFEGWFGGDYVIAQDWYKPDIAHIEVRQYINSTRTDSPDVVKAFLVRVDGGDLGRIRHYPASIARMLAMAKEKRDERGLLMPITIKLPEIDLLDLPI